jgi:TolB protein
VRGYAEIWRVRADGTGKQRVSRRGWIASQPAWSPDGKRLAYVRTWEIMVGGYPEQRSAIYLVRRDGTGTRRLHSGWGPAWSPDGRVIAFTYQGSSLAAIRPDGRHFRQLREDVAPGQAQFGPVGRRLVFIDVPIGGASVVRILDMRTGRLRAVPKDPSGEQPQSVTWTPDGRRLAYFRNRWISVGDTRRVGAVELCVVRPDGSGRRRLATLPSEVMSWEGLSWSR